MTELRIWTTRQTVKVAAPPKRVFELVANIDRWPALLDSLTAVEHLGFEGVCERVRFSASTGDTSTFVREMNTRRLQVRFRRLDPSAPFASMGGLWLVVPKAAGAVIALDHYYRVLDDSPVTAARLAREIAADSAAVLGTLRQTAEFGGVADLIASSVTPERESSS